MTKSLYQDHFGIRENPFSIIPDPHYLFMSQRHQEALAHLLYGISESGGFVLLTGEVGTGKTTICRALIEQLPDTVDLALILNPKLNEAELMASICDEMRIPYPLGTTSLKDYFDFMNKYLLEAHARGRNPVLMIDEAQNLSSQVLELIRLLTNLETAQKKLLQIILVGQPELNHILAQEDQRQTAQRITARYHLYPLGLMETRNYITHRLKVAGLDDRVFVPSAIKAVHKAARGIPRLINSICDRSLLAAYVEGRKQVTAKIARTAADEVLGTQGVPSGNSVWGMLGLALLIVGLIFMVGFDPYRTGIKDTLGEIIEPLLPPSDPAQIAAPKPVPGPGPEPKPEPVVIAEPVAEAVVEPAPEPMAEPVAEPVTEPVAEPVTDPVPEPAAPVAPVVPAVQDVQELQGEDISQTEGTLLGSLIQGGTPDRAFQNLFAVWHQDYAKLAGLTPCNKAQAANLSCTQGETNILGLKAMNRPVVVSFVMPDGEHVYGVVKAVKDGVKDDTITLAFDQRSLTLKAAAFMLRWPGDYLVLWKPTTGMDKPLVFGQQGTDVKILRRLIAQAGYGDGLYDALGQGSVFYGPGLRDKVRAFQADHGLRVDGIAGPETLMRITGVAEATAVPPIHMRAE